MYQGEALAVSVQEDGIAELRFDLAGESVNKFNALTLGELGEAVQALSAAQADIRGLLVTSGKGVFIVGADITEFKQWFQLPEQELVTEVMQIHETFAALEDLPFPSVAVVNGFALGGGFEAALSCDFRVMSTTARVGLPEVKLGLFPGWGGTIRLPRLIGLDNAIEWIATGRDQSHDDALKAGAVDAAAAPERLRDAGLTLLQQCIDGKIDYRPRRSEKTGPVLLNDTEKTMVFTTAKAFIAAKAGRHYPAPMIALEAMEQHVGLDREQAAPIEAAAFAKVAKTDTATSLVGLFLNDQALKRQSKRTSKTGREVRRAAVLGAGIMGGGIAYQTALKGIPIVMKDINEGALDTGLKEARKLLVKRVERARMSVDRMAEVLTRIDPTLAYAELANVDIAIEAVVENPEIKSKVLRELEAVVGTDTIIATNTSTISIDHLAAALKRPGRFCGMHFFNPVPVMPLVEVIRGSNTDEEAVATTVAFASRIGKSPIVVNDCPGFLVNRILFPYFNAFELLLRDGADFRRVDKVMERFGWPMGPAYLLDVIGMDTAHHAAEVLAQGYPDRMQLDFESAAALLHAAGRLGQKSGSGFYRYTSDEKGRPSKEFDESVMDVLGPVAQGTQDLEGDNIVQRMMVPMCLEAVRCLEDGVVESAAAADMGLIWGIGFPPHLGGALKYIDALGADQFCTIADQYADLGPAYQVTDKLREMAASGDKFLA